MRLFRATDTIDVPHPTILIVSDPGIGKTTLGYGAERALLKDFDKGAHRAQNRRETIQPESWQDVEDVLNKPQILHDFFGKTQDDFGSFVIDTAGRLLDLLTLDIIQKNTKHGRDGALNQQGWGQLKARFTTYKNRLHSLNKNLVLLCHGKEEKNGENTIIRPDVQGGSLGELLKSADLIGYLHMDGNERVLDWAPSERYIAKSPGWDRMKVPDFKTDPNFLAKIQQKAREDLGRMSADSATAAAQIADMLDAIAQADGLDVLNTLYKNRETVPAFVRAQIRTPLTERAKTLGGTFDKAAGAFVKETKEKDVKEPAA